MTEEFDWNEFSEILSSAAKDHILSSMYFHITGWEEAFRKRNLSPEAWTLIELLKNPIFKKFDNQLFRLSSSASRVNLGLLATWLTRRTLAVGVTEAVAGLKSYMDNREFQMTDVLVMRGIHIDKIYEIESGIQFSPLHSLPKEIAESLQAYLQPMMRTGLPSAAIIMSYTLSDELSESDFFHNYLAPRYHTQQLFWLTLGIFCESGAPVPLARWSLLPDWVPFSGILDSMYTSQLELKPPHGEGEISGELLITAIELYCKLKKLPKSVQAPIEIALGRFSQSMNTWSKEQKAIDLGVSLETFLTSKDTRDQLSLQFRVIGSLLTGDTLQERLIHHDIFKALYELRSAAVHNGTIGNSKFKIHGTELKIDSSKALCLASDLAKKAIRRYIELGGLSASDHKAFLLSAGMRTSD